ncbi:MAG: DUF805 domain-containing protein [Proteobacteria bacterium]|nr:DUF805 domain-containing protein [Pseudomonadota bacterium]
MLKLFFSTKGRVNRLVYWISEVICFVPLVIAGEAIKQPDNFQFGVILGMIFFWPWFVIQIKRLHDINHSGWWLLANLIPFIGPLSLFIVSGFWAGTMGTNRFGDSPWKWGKVD